MLEFMINVVKVYWSDILLISVFLGSLVVLYKYKKMELIRKIVLSLVIQAEKSLGAGTGELKYTIVVDQVYRLLPVSIKWLITKREIDDMIEWSVSYLKEYLGDDKDLLGI